MRYWWSPSKRCYHARQSLFWSSTSTVRYIRSINTVLGLINRCNIIFKTLTCIFLGFSFRSLGHRTWYWKSRCNKLLAQYWLCIYCRAHIDCHCFFLFFFHLKSWIQFQWDWTQIHGCSVQMAHSDTTKKKCTELLNYHKKEILWYLFIISHLFNAPI